MAERGGLGGWKGIAVVVAAAVLKMTGREGGYFEGGSQSLGGRRMRPFLFNVRNEMGFKWGRIGCCRVELGVMLRRRRRGDDDVSK